MDTTIRGGRVLRGHAFVQAEVSVGGGYIRAVGGEDAPAANVLDVSGCYVVPGFIDGHIHGSFGYNCEAGYEALCAISQGLARHGCTAFLPTMAALTPEQTRSALQGVQRAIDQGVPGAVVLGAHLEGPFMQQGGYSGALNDQAFCDATLDNWQALVGPYEHLVRRVTMDPLRGGSQQLVGYLTARGIGVSLGHSAATAEQALAFFDAGARSVTHLFNAMSPLKHREPGVVGAAVSRPDVVCELICDMVHIHPVALKVALLAKGAAGAMLISDAMEATGLGDGEYELGGRTVFVRDGVARIPQGNLAGSTLTMDAAVRNVTGRLKLPLWQAVQMASLTPAHVCGAHDRGAIEPGHVADLVVLDEALQVRTVLIGGRVAYEA